MMEQKGSLFPHGEGKEGDVEEAMTSLLPTDQNGERPLNFHGNKISNWTAPAIILGYECFESLGINGISTNLVVYLSSVFHESNVSIAKSITTWTGTSYLTPFLGALIADSYLGSYWIIFFSSLLYLLGMVMITLTASFQTLTPLPCVQSVCPSPTNFQNLAFFSGLYMVAVGSGGVKSSLLPLGADQFDENNPRDRQRKASFFNWFYFCLNIGSLVSSTLIVWIQENVDWGIGYGIATVCMAFAVGIFFLGSPTFRVRIAGGRPLKRLVHVSISSFRRVKFRARKIIPALHEVQPITPDFHQKNESVSKKTVNRSLLDVQDERCQTLKMFTDIEKKQFKSLMRLLPIWITSIIFSISYAQLSTTFVEQGRAMDTRLGSFAVPPASLIAFEVLSVMLWVVIYDTVIVKLARNYFKNNTGLTQLQRMGIGYFFMMSTMAMAAMVEAKRLESAGSGKFLRISWQLPQYFLIAGAEVFTYVGQLEFFYDQGPENMRNLSTALSLLTISLGNYLSSLMVALIEAVTAEGDDHVGWIAEDLNRGHLDYFFLLLAGVSGVDFIAYCVCSTMFPPMEDGNVRSVVVL